jgi:23S rRNA A2030 N6-methylase RlmJ
MIGYRYGAHSIKSHRGTRGLANAAMIVISPPNKYPKRFAQRRNSLKKKRALRK